MDAVTEGIAKRKTLLKYLLKIGDQIKTIQADLTPGQRKGSVDIDGVRLDVSFCPVGNNRYHIMIDGRPYNVWINTHDHGKQIFVNGYTLTVEDVTHAKSGRPRRKPLEETPSNVTPPMPSVVVRVMVREGERVEKGQGLVVVTAMKMETTLKAPYSGIVQKVNTQVNAKVMPGDILVEIQKEDSGHD
ncbi:MAG: hypothetical protein JRJ75_08610 [Deltaproteobacteria bacterium]|nr:hypothetical protein [Deltaproteobacteria bacterium]